MNNSQTCFSRKLGIEVWLPSYLFPSILAITYFDVSNQNRTRVANLLDMQMTWIPHLCRGLTKCFILSEVGMGRKRVTKWQGMSQLFPKCPFPHFVATYSASSETVKNHCTFIIYVCVYIYMTHFYWDNTLEFFALAPCPHKAKPCGSFFKSGHFFPGV